MILGSGPIASSPLAASGTAVVLAQRSLSAEAAINKAIALTAQLQAAVLLSRSRGVDLQGAVKKFGLTAAANSEGAIRTGRSISASLQAQIGLTPIKLVQAQAAITMGRSAGTNAQGFIALGGTKFVSGEGAIIKTLAANVSSNALISVPGSTTRFLAAQGAMTRLLTASANLDAAIKLARASGLSANAVQQATKTIGMTAHALVGTAHVALSNLQAAVKVARLSSLASEALIFDDRSQTVQAQAILIKGVNRSASANAAIGLPTQLRAVSAQAIVVRRQSLGLAADALVRRAVSRQTAVDAWISGIRFEASVSLEAHAFIGNPVVTPRFPKGAPKGRGRIKGVFRDGGRG